MYVNKVKFILRRQIVNLLTVYVIADFHAIFEKSREIFYEAD